MVNKINDLLNENKISFWKKIAKSRKLKSKRATVLSSKPSTEEFVTFYRDLFFHSDRPSNARHLSISDSVKQYMATFIGDMTNVPIFRELICKTLHELKLDMSAGFGGLSNEFIIFLFALFNLIFNSGHIPMGFNSSVLIPIPKKE